MGGVFGEQKIVLKAGEAKQFGAPIQGFGAYPVKIDCVPKGETVTRAVSRTMWQHDPRARQILFVVPQEGRLLPRLWSVVDRGPEQNEG